LANAGLVQKTIDHKRVVPVRLVAAIFVVSGDMVKVAIAAGKESTTEAACPGDEVRNRCLLADTSGKAAGTGSRAQFL